MNLLIAPLLFLCICFSSLMSSPEVIDVGIPPELKGFRGMMKGELVAKKETSFVFKIEKIKKTWKGNKAENASKSIGKSITLSLSKVSSHHGGRIMSNYRKMKKGDRIELEAFDLEETNLCIKEWLKKVDESKEK